jgi:threonine synthase
LVKDESSNPTGTHKDRMAWEILLYYKRKLQSLVNSEKEVLKTPQLSIISSGSSALAIQALLNKFGLPPIKVLIKNGFKEEVYEKLSMAGCELFIKDLTIKKLNRNDVLNHTDNKNGIEVSFRDAIDPAHFEYYDWLSYEILNQNPTTVIVPFGSGELFTNILNVAKNEVLLNKQDKRFKGNKKSISNCKFFGVTTTNPNSKYFKLCSYFFDCNQYNKEQMEMYRRLNICNNESKVVDLEEEYFEQAEKLCKKLKLNVEESSLSGFAFYLENQEKFKDEERIIIVNTGKTKKILPPTTYIKNSGFGA